MALISRTAVSLRFMGDRLIPEEVSMMLGCQADVGALKDGAWRTTTGVERIARPGMWHKSVARRSPGDLDRQVIELLALMTDDLAIWQRLTTQFRADVFCGLFLDETNQGVVLSPKTLLALGARGLELGLDVYGLAGRQEASEFP